MSKTVSELLSFIAFQDAEEITLKFDSVDCSFVDNKGQNALFPEIARKKGLTAFFIERGASVHQQNIDGNTPLHLAAANTNIEATRILLQHGASVEAENKFGNQPLWVALLEAIKVSKQPDGYEVLKRILDAKPDLDHKNHAGMSPRFFCEANVTDKRIRARFLNE